MTEEGVDTTDATHDSDNLDLNEEELRPGNLRQLSLLEITGPLDLNTPECVISEIQTCYQIPSTNINDRQAYCQSLNLLSPIPLPRDWLHNDFSLAHIARLINPDINWLENNSTRACLSRAVLFLSLFMTQRVSDPHLYCGLNLPAYPLGLPTIEHPESLTACLVYRICRLHDVRVTYQTTHQEMYDIIRILHRPLQEVQTLLSNVIQSLPSPQIFEAYGMLNGLSQVATQVTTQSSSRISSSSSSSSSSDSEEDEEEDEEVTIQTTGPALVLEPASVASVASDASEMSDGDTNGDNTPDDRKRKLAESQTSYEKLLDCHRVFNDHRRVLQRLQPHNEVEAITLAILNFGMDISKSRVPLEEYDRLQDTNYLNKPRLALTPRPPTAPQNPTRNVRVTRRGGLLSSTLTNNTTSRPLPINQPSKTGPAYTPVDPVLSERYLKDPESLMIRSFFNPQLPVEFYSGAQLHTLALGEGYLSSELNNGDAYEMLQCAYLTENFYTHPWLIPNNDSTPLFALDVPELPWDQRIYFGVLEPYPEVTVLSFRELADWFAHTRNFVNPLDRKNNVFDARLIRKLKLICRKNRTTESAEAVEERRHLLKVIETVDCELHEKNSQILQLVQVYKQEKLRQSAIREALIALLDVSMYLRGWEGEEAYPVEEAPEKNLDEIELRVTQQILRFQRLADDLGHIGEMIYKLPILKYTGGEFQVIINERVGRNIKEKLDIIMRGNDEDALYSCIRISSSLICATVYRVMQAIGLDLPFDIQNLRSIS